MAFDEGYYFSVLITSARPFRTVRIRGQLLGPYAIETLLGAGGMGEVYRARDTRLDRLAALKVLPERASSDPNFRRRLTHEAKSISQLNHPHICTLYDLGSHAGIASL